MRSFFACVAAAIVSIPVTTWAYAGPESTAVLANADVAESVDLANQYVTARQIPQRQLCKVSAPTTDDVSLTDYTAKILGPFETCLQKAGVLDRIEAIVVMKGMPLRVVIQSHTAALTATLGIWKSVMTTDKTPVLGQDPGEIADCGGPCLAAHWKNALYYLPTDFNATHAQTRYGVDWKMKIVTMLNARTYADAAKLITSAIDGEKNGGAKGTFMFMDGADGARNVLDVEYDGVMTQLKAKGFTDVKEVPFDSNLTGQKLSAFFTGTAGIGQTIEGNTYAPGTIVDNLTSYGAVPQNFAPTGETQVSIARWVAMGVAGVHGTVDEPLNNCFPSRYLIVDYVDGAPLGEAYMRRMPYVYWRNLILGDVMLAPYAKRPNVAVTGVSAGATVTGAKPITVKATDATGLGIRHIQVFLDGVMLAEGDGDTLNVCLKVPVQKGVQLLAVAQSNPGAGSAAKFPPKGWTSFLVDGAAGGDADCPPPPEPDAGVPEEDAGTTSDGGTTPPGDKGCSCNATRASDLPNAGLLAVVFWFARRRRRDG